MDLQIQPLPFDPSRLHGVSERIVSSHHANNYGGAVRRYNAIRAQWHALDPAAAAGFQLNGLKREELIAANSAFLHELHFDNLGGDGALADGPMKTVLAQAFGSFERWQAEFTAMGRALAGGSGWVLLVWSPRHAALVNQWAADHAHALAGAEPLIALDLYEHAYHLDFGANAGAWVDAFMRNLHWERTAARFERAVAQSTAALAVTPRDVAAAGDRWQLVDVRRRPVYAGAPGVPGARWRDPEQVAQWVGTLERDRPVAVYCVHGHAISRSVAAQLAQHGIDARVIAGGIEAWSAQGLPLAPRGDQP
jgi:Fe-Mn family superoxide dismutase